MHPSLTLMVISPFSHINVSQSSTYLTVKVSAIEKAGLNYESESLPPVLNVAMTQRSDSRKIL
jgi:hypothetical protein